jgi:hypothetical protein
LESREKIKTDWKRVNGEWVNQKTGSRFENRERSVIEKVNPRALPLIDEIRRDQAEYRSDQEDVHKPLPQGTKYKVVVSGHVVEVYEYEKHVRTGPRGEASALIIDEDTGEILNREVYDKDEARRNNARRAKNELRRLIVSNFEATHDKFITLTFRDGAVGDVTNVKECNVAFDKFMKRLRRYITKHKPQYKNFNYVKVIEFQDSNGRGAVHFHMLAQLPFLRFETIAEIWGNGFIGINRIEHVDNLGAYVTKYMVKDMDDMRLAGEKSYTTSQGLVRPITLHGMDAIEIIEQHLKDRKEVFKNSYSSEHTGKVTYKEFNMKRS